MTAASEDVILLDDTLTETFLTDLQSRGRTEETLKCYRNSLGKLCGFLPGRRLSHEAMRRWPEALREQGYRATVTPVLAVRVPNVPGGLAKLLEFMDEQDANVAYGYCFSENEDYAVDVLKADGSDDLEQKLTDAGFEPVRPEDIYRID